MRPHDPILKKEEPMKIRNVNDLARELQCDPTEASLSRRIYKGTSCGAWLALEDVLVPSAAPRPQRWQVRARLGIPGVCITARRNARGPWLAPKDVPKNVRDYFCANEKGWVTLARDGVGGAFDDWAGFVAAVNGDEACRVQRARRPVGRQVQALVTLDPEFGCGCRKPGVTVGSIVEGVDQCAKPVSLAFPFSSSVFWAAVQSVEDECDEIWKSTHGCEGCARLHGIDYDDPGTANGYVPVHPDCKECGGTGQIM